MHIDNRTPYPHAITVVTDIDGRDVAMVLIKATLRLTVNAPAPAQEPIHYADVFFPSGALRYPTDLSFDRPGSDVIVHGTAFAPHGLPHESFAVTIRLADTCSRIRVTGPRTWQRTAEGYRPTKPKPIESVPLTHEHAYGGPGFDGNPIGVGFAQDGAAVEGKPLPLLEAADEPMTTPARRVTPPAFGAVAPGWSPRKGHVGEYGNTWKRYRAPTWPLDMDRRFFSAAPDALRTTNALVGGETITLEGLHREGPVHTIIPRLPLRVLVEQTFFRPRIDRIVIEPDLDRRIVCYRLMQPASISSARILEKRIVNAGEGAT